MSLRLLVIVSLLAGVSTSLLAGAPVTAAAPRQAGGVPLRQVNWDSFLATDPLVQSDGGECIPPPPSARLGPCVSVALAQPMAVNGLGGPSDPLTTGFSGYADTADILYADLDGDGFEEAVIPTQSTGTGGSFGFLVYHQADAGPQLVVAYPGYKLGVSIQNGLLVVRQPFYFGFEPNCCPTGLTENDYLLGDGGLYAAADPTYSLFNDVGNQRQVTPAELTVAGYYRAIDNSAYDVAYALLSPQARALRSFDVFMAGYSTTRSVSVTVAPGSTTDEVRVTISSTDDGPDGRPVTKQFAGSWFVTADPAAPLGVYLARASIQQTQ